MADEERVQVWWLGIIVGLVSIVGDWEMGIGIAIGLYAALILTNRAIT